MSEKRGKSVKIEKTDDEIDFSWGKKRGRGGKNKEFQFYESFRFDGVEYSLYDSVYLFKHGEVEPYVGKLIKIYTGEENVKRVKILWFFRPSEISNYLQGVGMVDNEVFLATGDGVGLTKVNPLEAIAGKCNVVCISKDERNRQPSVEELKMADYVFYRTFDVQHFTISDNLDEKIAMVDVRLLLNKNDPHPADFAKIVNVNVTVDAAKPLILVEDTVVADSLVDSNTNADNTVSTPGEAKKAVANKDARHVDADVNSDAGLSSSLVKEDKPSIEKGDAPKPDSTSVAPSTFKRVLKSGQKTISTSPDLKQTRLKEVGRDAVVVAATVHGQSEPMNDVKRQNNVGLAKKPKLDGGAQKTIGTGGTGTQKSGKITPDSKKASEPTDSAAETINGGKLIRESSSLSDTPLRKQTYNGVTPIKDEKFGDKSSKASGKVAKDSHNFINKAPSRPGGVLDSNGRGKLSRERDGTSEGVSKKRRISNVIEHKPIDKLGKLKQPNNDEIGASNQVKEVTQPPQVRKKWFTGGLWEDRMKDAYDQEKLVLLQNLDPTYSAAEVEDIVLRGFQESCETHIVQHTATSSPHSGQAFAIFNTREVAQKIIRKLEQNCLMLPNGRPLVGTVDIMKFPGKKSQYFGHLVIDKLKYHTSQRDAVSTSHPAQPNTIEYEMALEWRLLQDRSDLWWEKLLQKQGEDIKKLQARLKSN